LPARIERQPHDRRQRLAPWQLVGVVLEWTNNDDRSIGFRDRGFKDGSFALPCRQG
jgi:hypothetical protein